MIVATTPQRVRIALRLKEPGRLAVSSLVTVAQETVKALRELEWAMHPDARPSDWYITSIRMDDAVVFDLVPSGVLGLQAADDYVAGLRLIRRRNQIPTQFTYSVFQHAKKTLAVQDNGVARLLITSPASRVRSSAELAKRVSSIASEGYYEWTSLVGLLDTLRWDEERPRFTITDLLTGKRTECVFRLDDFEEVKNALPRRVEVSGRARFNRLGEPVKIEVDAWEPSPDDSALPRREDMRNVNITGGLDAAEYLRGLRDGE